MTHGLGVVLSVFGLVSLILTACAHGTARDVLAASIYGVTLVALYASSTLYHLVREPRAKSMCRLIDHASIYLMIAGSYTPFALISLNGAYGWAVFAGVWFLALAGVAVKIFLKGHFGLLSSFLYLAMGWISMAFLNPLLERVAPLGIFWLIAGGAVYTVGVIFYSWKSFPYNHAIWHLFVLGGSACHFLSILLYVLPRE